MLWLLFIFIFGRLAEALHPGPLQSGSSDTSLHHGDTLVQPNPSTTAFLLGTCNPSGVTGKAASFLGLPRGMWGVTETQATASSFGSFKRETTYLGKSMQRRIRTLHGEYVALRPGSDTAGSWSGVAFFGDFPIRPLRLPWQSVEYTSGRVFASDIHVGALHILAAVVYLPPSGPTYGTTSKICNELLASITEEVVFGSRGMRYVCGDFNRSHDGLATFDSWRSAGWVEVQQLALQRFQRTPTPTSKGTAFSDQIWISPELARHLSSVHSIEEVFADHDPLYAVFDLPTGLPRVHHWPTPALFPWDELPAKPAFATLPELDQDRFRANPTRAFAAWSGSVEHMVTQAFHDAQVPLPRGVTGRGQTLEPVLRPMRFPPLRHGRHGEDVPISDFLNRNIHFWFKQLRRLQADTQRATRMIGSPAVQVDQSRTWSNVVRAAGFKGGFASWWASRKIQLHGSPTAIPRWPPDLHTAKLIYDDFRINYRDYERWQLGRRRQLIAAKAHDHNKLLFRQLRQQDMSPPDHFTLECSLTISDVLDAQTIEVEGDLNVPAKATWLLQQCPATVTHIRGQCLTIECDLLPQIGHTLRGSWMVTDFQSMEAALSELWLPIWKRHLDAPPEMWQRALCFMDAFLPKLPASFISWNGTKVARLVAGYKKHTATGSDGWSRADVASLPAQAHMQIAEMYELIQDGADWPRQLQTGLVCPVRKIPEALTPMQYRPIILLPFLYRLWAVGSSRTLLPKMLQVAGQHVYGFLPSRRASDLWWLLQAAIESCFFEHGSLTGFNLDLVRCFNYIPRHPIFWGMKRLGLPAATLASWEAGLRQLERRFRVGAEVGPPHHSVCGFPEGDPLSCVAMVFFDVVMELYVRQYAGQVQLVSYVDNIQLLSDSVGSLCTGLVVLRTCLSMFDLVEDLGKSYAWATSSLLRAQLRTHGMNVKLAMKDLGAQMTFSQLLRSTTTTERVESVQHFWALLSRSPVASWFKLLSIRAAAWPKALHACENKLVPVSVTSTLRTKALFALGWRRAGASPWIRWSLMLPYDMDPDFHQYWAILRMALRMFGLYPHVRDHWRCFADATTLPSGQGPLHSLWLVLQQLDWRWDGDLVLEAFGMVMPFGSLHLLLLRRILEASWDRVICTRMPDRQDFTGMTSVDRRMSFQPLTSSAADNELLNTIQDGTFYTNYQISRFDPTCGGFCTQCNVEDTLEHRCLQCPRYTAIRRKHMPCINRWSQFGTAFTHHGIVPCNAFLQSWWHYLVALPDTTRDYFCMPLHGAEYDLFTDGTCTQHDSRVGDYAAWAVALPDMRRILSHGLLPGIVQSINRAEILGVTSALAWKLLGPCILRVWSDRKLVVTNIQFLRDYDYVPPHWSNQDLWLPLLAIVRVIDWTTCTVTWLPSHRDIRTADGPFEEWQILGNDMADRAAERCNQARGPSFERLSADLQCEQRRLQSLASSQRLFLLAMSKADLHRSTSEVPWDEEDQTIGSLVDGLMVNDCSVASLLEPIIEPRLADFPQFQIEFIADLVNWLSGLDILAQYRQPSWFLVLLPSRGMLFPLLLLEDLYSALCILETCI